jgi:hypothetical protein
VDDDIGHGYHHQTYHVYNEGTPNIAPLRVIRCYKVFEKAHTSIPIEMNWVSGYSSILVAKHAYCQPFNIFPGHIFAS